MKGEFISIETLKIWQEIEKENKELHEKIDLILKEIKKVENVDMNGNNLYTFINKIENIINGDSNE